tara:strand:+ start:286 stop:552 length:267 start_codon:yes stop_codon:yes gene_type:complete
MALSEPRRFNSFCSNFLAFKVFFPPVPGVVALPTGPLAPALQAEIIEVDIVSNHARSRVPKNSQPLALARRRIECFSLSYCLSQIQAR